MQFPELTWNSMNLHEVSWACMQFPELTWSFMSLHEVSWGCMQFHELACSFKSLYAVPFFVWAAHKNFAVLVCFAWIVWLRDLNTFTIKNVHWDWDTCIEHWSGAYFNFPSACLNQFSICLKINFCCKLPSKPLPSAGSNTLQQDAYKLWLPKVAKECKS